MKRDRQGQEHRIGRGMRVRSGTEYIRLDSRACKACWKCIEACPENVFSKINIIVHKHAKIASQDSCTGCLRCVKSCEYGAINPVAKKDEMDRNI